MITRQNELADALKIKLPSPIQKEYWIGTQQNIWIKRDDLIHPVISGNKYRKLSPILETALTEGWQHVISFGGAFSNHIHALAYACSRLGIKCTLVIRGERPPKLSYTLQDVIGWGAELIFVTREEYKRRNSADYCTGLKRKLNADVVIPEGGSTFSDNQGLAQLYREITEIIESPQIICPVGSGGTFIGLLKAQVSPSKIIGINVLKAPKLQHQLAEQYCPDKEEGKDWTIYDEFHHGGYAKTNKILESFIADEKAYSGIELDHVYNAKSFFAVNQLFKDKAINTEQPVCLIHTGGNQGIRGLSA